MSEALKFEGRLAQTRIEAEQLKLKIQGLIGSIRDLLDPTEPRIENIRTAIAAAQAVELDAAMTDYKGRLAEMAEIKRILGR